jgi:uncharacterized membrane protein YcaP (DUF421 family)
MKKEDISITDIQRILFGEAPPIFLLEVFIRTLILYVLALIMIRLLGKRMNADASIIEMAVMITLGAVISASMQMPDRGILQAILLMSCTLIFHRGVSVLSFKSETLDKIIQGNNSIIVKDGVIQIDDMKKSSLSKHIVMSTLRSKGILSLGKVRRMYMEASGDFSVFVAKEPKPGLSTLPGSDEAVFQTQRSWQNIAVCKNCGYVVKDNPSQCPNCGFKDNPWVNPVI